MRNLVGRCDRAPHAAAFFDVILPRRPLDTEAAFGLASCAGVRSLRVRQARRWGPTTTGKKSTPTPGGALSHELENERKPQLGESVKKRSRGHASEGNCQYPIIINCAALHYRKTTPLLMRPAVFRPTSRVTLASRNGARSVTIALAGDSLLRFAAFFRTKSFEQTGAPSDFSTHLRPHRHRNDYFLSRLTRSGLPQLLR